MWEIKIQNIKWYQNSDFKAHALAEFQSMKKSFPKIKWPGKHGNMEKMPGFGHLYPAQDYKWKPEQVDKNKENIKK